MVSVIMNGHNAEEYLQEAIDSVLSQTYDNFEVVFFDNCSTDSTKKIVESYSNSRIKYFYSSDFLVLGDARNQAIEHSKGDLIAFLDCDDLWLPRKLELQVPLFDNKKIGIVISDTIFFDHIKDRSQLFKSVKPPTGKVFRELILNYCISLETAVVRKSALDSMDHWFDPEFNMIEEYDLFLRMAHDWELGFVDSVLAKWRMHDSSWTWSKSELFPKERKSMLDKFKRTIPNFTEDNYYDELRMLQRSIDWDIARIHWKQGERGKARKLIAIYKYDRFKWFILWLFAWMPYFVFNTVSKILGKVNP